MYVSYGVLLGFQLIKKQRVERISLAVALTVNAAILITIPISSGYLPLFNIFESFVLAAFILGILGLSLFRQGANNHLARSWVWVGILLLLFVVCFYPKEAAPPRHNHGELFIVFFHGFRTLSLAAMLFSSAQYATFLTAQVHDATGKGILHQGRNFLLLGTILFLVSEYSGILWCLNGWGDFWRWNYGFLSSTFILLYLMLVFHLPDKNLFSRRIMPVIGMMSGVVMVGIMVSRSAV
jgi:ABC-type transport system involved in cytochrome c biogenesis permease subunit